MIFNTFDRSEEGWCSYDYEKSLQAKISFFVLAAWLPHAGMNNSGFIWADEHRFSIDIPENPVSILPFLFYTRWMGLDAIRLKDRIVSMYLRGFHLDMKGSRCYFWMSGGADCYTRWHHNIPLEINHEEWPQEPQTLILSNEAKNWRMSWAEDENYCPLDLVLENANCYGLAFVGFKEKVTGCIAMDNFSIR